MLTQRSQEKELLDLGPNFYTPTEYEHCQQMLFRVNKLFGFFKDTKQLLKKFTHHTSVLDVGCGAGLFILNLNRSFPLMTFLGTDISISSIELAQLNLHHWQKEYSQVNVSFTLQNTPYIQLPPNSIDVILTTMVCHHLDDADLVQFIENLFQTAKKAVIINDLHRHPIAEFFYAMLSPLLFKNRLITHDGLISIRKGFTRNELKSILEKANIKHYTLKWCFPFRWSLILCKQQ